MASHRLPTLPERTPANQQTRPVAVPVRRRPLAAIYLGRTVRVQELSERTRTQAEMISMSLALFILERLAAYQLPGSGHLFFFSALCIYLTRASFTLAGYAREDGRHNPARLARAAGVFALTVAVAGLARGIHQVASGDLTGVEAIFRGPFHG